MTEKTKEQTEYEKLQEIGRRAMESIAEMVDALECDYDRKEALETELEDACTGQSEHNVWGNEWLEATANDDQHTMQEAAQELIELRKAAGECESREDAEQRIQEDPLSLEFRSGWSTSREDLQPEEFKLLLGTGGPAVQIVGEINDGEPCNVRLQAQDWFTPWTDYRDQDEETLLTYCRCFYFGD